MYSGGFGYTSLSLGRSPIVVRHSGGGLVGWGSGSRGKVIHSSASFFTYDCSSVLSVVCFRGEGLVSWIAVENLGLAEGELGCLEIYLEPERGDTRVEHLKF